MAIQRTEAFVLKTQLFRSSSLIITFFSRDFGKMKGIAKGVRRERELRGALFELFTHLEIVFYEKTRSDLHLVSEASLLDTHNAIRSDLISITYASYFSELVDSLCEIHDPHEKVYDLLEFCFRLLSAVPVERLSIIFEVKLLQEIGWIPYLNACLISGKPIGEKAYFSIKQGGLIAPGHIANVRDAVAISPEAIFILRYLSSHTPEEALRQHMAETTEKELRKTLDQFLTYRLGHALKSKLFLSKIAQAGFLT